MSIWTKVPGEVGECRVAAHRLERLTGALEEAGATSAEQSRLAEADFGGAAGSAYRTQVRDLTVLVDLEAQRCRALSRGLLRLADGLEEAESLMASAREETRHGLVLEGWTLQRSPGGDGAVGIGVGIGVGGATGGGQARAWARATALADRARAVERDAQLAWRDALARVTGVRDSLTAYDEDLLPNPPTLGPPR